MEEVGIIFFLMMMIFVVKLAGRKLAWKFFQSLLGSPMMGFDGRNMGIPAIMSRCLSETVSLQ